MVIDHLESFLGKLESGSKLTDRKYKIRTARFLDQPFEGINTYSTIGLSNYELRSPNKKIRIELLFSAYNHFDGREIASFLLGFAEHLIESKRVLLRGDVIGPKNSITSETNMAGVYCSIPIFFEENFHVLQYDNRSVVFVWLIPIYKSEIQFIRKNGWDRFEEILEEKEIFNFWDLNRKEFEF